MTDFQDDFRDMLRLLKRQHAEFIVIGGHALAAHGIIRATEDLDIWFNPTPENAPRVWNALVEFQAPLAGITLDDLIGPKHFLRFGHPPGRVELLSKISGLTFSDAWNHHIDADILGVDVPVLSRQDMIVNKRASGRPKDLLDADDLEAGRMR